MAYTAPTTRTTGTLITASIWNTDMVDNISYLYSNLKLVQYAAASLTGTGTTTIPFDGTIPQNTEGDQYGTQAITPANSSNKLYITANFSCTHTATGAMSLALFQDTTANALAAVSGYVVANQTVTLSLIHSMAAGTTSSTTFKIRAGHVSAGTTTANSAFGAAGVSYLVVQEIKV